MANCGPAMRWSIHLPLLMLLLRAPGLGQQPVGELLTSDATLKGSVILTGHGMQVGSGSVIEAGAAAATLRLFRGGELRICPRTTLTVSSSAAGDLLLGLGTGAIETHYPLASRADSILTADFRILLTGPGDFHFAVSIDTRGNTCLRALDSNNASLIVSELMGDGSYQVKPSEQVILLGGKVSQVSAAGAEACGCPAVTLPREAASREPPAAQGSPREHPSASVTAPLPPPLLGQLQVEIDAPFVFRGDESQPPSAYTLARVNLASLPQLMAGIDVLPPNSAAPGPKAAAHSPQRPKRHFFGKIRAFFAAILHR